jgi:hypothetical protein
MGLMLTMLPGSPLPRAKMKIVRGHEVLLPVSSSLRVALAWRASSLIGEGSATGAGTATGDAIARVHRREMMAKYFILMMVIEVMEYAHLALND